MIDGKIIHIAGESTDNGKGALPLSLSFGIKRSAAITIFTVPNHVINTLAAQFCDRNLFFSSHPFQNTRLIFRQLYLCGYHF